MRLAICNELWRDVPIEQIFARAAAIGFDGVELAPFTLAESVEDITASRRQEIVRAAADAGVSIVGLHWLFLSPPGLHLTTPDDAVRRRSGEYIAALADFCADVGGSVMIFGSPKQRDITPPTTPEQGWTRAKEVYAAAGETLAARGVTLCIEALAPTETNFVQTAAEAARMADEIGHPNIDIMLDVKAMASMPDGIEGTIARFGSRAKHFHANDPSGKGPGMNGTDFKPILAALAKTSFDGWISVEPFDYEPDPDTVARRAIETLTAAAAD